VESGDPFSTRRKKGGWKLDPKPLSTATVEGEEGRRERRKGKKRRQGRRRRELEKNHTRIPWLPLFAHSQHPPLLSLSAISQSPASVRAAVSFLELVQSSSVTQDARLLSTAMLLLVMD
jgi:hypothetical protein